MRQSRYDYIIEIAPLCKMNDRHDELGRFARKDGASMSKIEQAVRKVEREIRNQDYETGVLFDDDGNIIWRVDGTERRVKPSDEQRAMMRGKVFTHNHPNNTAVFSRGDMFSFVAHGPREIRATTPQGKTVSIKIRDSDVEIELLEKFTMDYTLILNKCYEDASKTIKRKIMLNDIQPEDELKEWLDLLNGSVDDWMKENAYLYGVEYKLDSEKNINKNRDESTVSKDFFSKLYEYAFSDDFDFDGEWNARVEATFAEFGRIHDEMVKKRAKLADIEEIDEV